MTSRIRTGSWLLGALLVFLSGCGSAGSDSETGATLDAESTSAPAQAESDESDDNTYGTVPGVDVPSPDYDAVIDECGQNEPIDGDLWAGLDSDLIAEINQPLSDAMDRMTGSNPTSCRPLDIVETAIDAQSVDASWATSLVHRDPELRIDVFVYEPGQVGNDELRAARAALTKALPADTEIHGAYTADNFAIVYSWLNSDGLEDTPRQVVLIGGYYSVQSFR